MEVHNRAECISSLSLSYCSYNLPSAVCVISESVSLRDKQRILLITVYDTDMTNSGGVCALGFCHSQFLPNRFVVCSFVCVCILSGQCVLIPYTFGFSFDVPGKGMYIVNSPMLNSFVDLALEFESD